MKFISRKPIIALLLRTSAKTYREILDGILRYTREQSPWSIQFCEGREADPREEFTGLSSCDGIIIDETSELFGDLGRFSKIPVVTITSVPPPRHLPKKRISLFCDNNAISKMAASYFIENGFEAFAYVNDRVVHPWSKMRGEAFAKALAAHGKACTTYGLSVLSTKHEYLRAHFQDWLRQLPKPTALFTANDIVARYVIDSCAEMNISIPGDIAILSCDNEEPICETCTPPLSSIAFSTEQAGYEAARTLHRLLVSAKPVSEASRIIPYGPSRIALRLSSEKHNTADPLVDKALHFIRLNLASPFTVDQLAKALRVSRRTLEGRFRKALNRGIHEEVIHTRLLHAREQLQTTTLSTEEIACNCGFPSASHLCVMFKRCFQMTPSTCRKQRTNRLPPNDSQ